jgi:DNA modification methylase
MRIIDITTIVVLDRDRTTMDPRALRELAWSIEARGLLHPIGVYRDETTGKDHLVWGERRLRAIEFLYSENKKIRLADKNIPIENGQIPVFDYEEVSDIALAEAELEENTQREELSWPDRARAIANIHALRKAQNPTQTVFETADEIAKRTGQNTLSLRAAPKSAATKHSMSVPLATFIAPHLNDPEVKKAGTLQGAFAIVARRQEEEATSALIRKRQARALASTDEPIKLLLGDAQDLIKNVKDNTVDLILTDIPYGINADGATFSKRQAQKHVYEDSPENFKNLATWLFQEAFRVAKSRANIFFFFDSKHLEFVYRTASSMAWEPFPSPIIWDKMTPGIGPWHTEGFQRSYELIFFATKGRRGLCKPTSDILRHKRVPTEQRRHAAQKPESLLRELIELSTHTGDLILDPFAGSGSTLVSAKLLKRRALGFEIDKALYDGALTNIFGTETTHATGT